MIREGKIRKKRNAEDTESGAREAKLVSGQVILFTMVRGGGTVCVCGEFVEFGSSLVRVIWHDVSLSSTHLRIIPFSKLSHKGQDPC